MGQFIERRRTPRITVGRATQFRLGRRVRMRVVDISAGGVLLWTEEPLPVGSEGRLNVLLDGMPMEAQIKITRDGPAGDGSGRLLGAVLTNLQPVQQRAFEQFLRRTGN